MAARDTDSQTRGDFEDLACQIATGLNATPDAPGKRKEKGGALGPSKKRARHVDPSRSHSAPDNSQDMPRANPHDSFVGSTFPPAHAVVTGVTDTSTGAALGHSQVHVDKLERNEGGSSKKTTKKAKRRKGPGRRRRCRKCPGCLTKSCGKCRTCINKSFKQACLLRKCQSPILPVDRWSHLDPQLSKLSPDLAYASDPVLPASDQMHHIPATITANVAGVDLFIPDHDNFGPQAVPVPPTLITDIISFMHRRNNCVSKITGKRNEVHLDGEKSVPWKNFMLKYISTCNPKRRKEIEACINFISSLREVIRALAVRAGYQDINMSPDIVALCLAEAEQTPHVDLLPGQVQSIMALTHNAKPTLAFGFNDSSVQRPSVEEAFKHLSINMNSNSKQADVLRSAPALGLPRSELLMGMRPVSLDETDSTDRLRDLEHTGLLGFSRRRTKVHRRSWTSSSSSLSSPSSSNYQSSALVRKKGRWAQGTIMLADHEVVHAGPQQDCVAEEPPRIVIFTTFTGYRDQRSARHAKRAGAPASFYNVSDQYLPYHFFEDPTMPAKRVVELLQEWAKEKPYQAFKDNTQSNACRQLCGNDSLTAEKIQQYIRILRTPPKLRIRREKSHGHPILSSSVSSSSSSSSSSA